MKLFCSSCEHVFKGGKEVAYCPKCGAALNGGHTEIVMVLDRSGSMQSCREATVAGFNEFIRDQKALPGEANVTLAQFDDEYEVIHDAIALREFPELNSDSFVPRGTTALLDAIGKTINTTSARCRHDKVVFVIITDGGENASKEYKRQNVMEMIQHREAGGWKFVFLGAGKDAIEEAKALGIAVNRIQEYAPTPEGTERAYRSASLCCTSYRASNTGDCALQSPEKL